MSLLADIVLLLLAGVSIVGLYILSGVGDDIHRIRTTLHEIGGMLSWERGGT